MDGVRARMEGDAEAEISTAWHGAAFYAASQSKRGLRPLNHYLKKPPVKMSDATMLANMKMIAAGVNRKFGSS